MGRQLRCFDLSDGPDAILPAIAEDGGVIVHHFISDDLLRRLVTELEGVASHVEPGLPGRGFKAKWAGRQTKRFTGLAARAPSFACVIDHDLMHSWATHSLGTDYWLNTGQAMIVGPGSVDQALHRDCALWPTMARLGKSGPEAIVSILLAISDFKAETGATRVVPGSHAWDDYEQQADSADVVQAVMPAGSALLYTGKVIHGAGANSTRDEWRFGIHMSFCRGELTPEEANCQTVPWDTARTFAPRVQRMLGFYSRRPWGKDPSLWMADFKELRDMLEPATDS